MLIAFFDSLIAFFESLYAFFDSSIVFFVLSTAFFIFFSTAAAFFTAAAAFFSAAIAFLDAVEEVVAEYYEANPKAAVKAKAAGARIIEDHPKTEQPPAAKSKKSQSEE